MKKFILLSTVLSFLFSAGAIAGEQDTIWTKEMSNAANACFLPGDSTIISTINKHFVLMKTETGEIIRESEELIAEKFLDFDYMKGKYLAALDYRQKRVILYDITNFKVKNNFYSDNDSNWISAVAISPDDRYIAVGLVWPDDDNRRVINIIEIETMTIIKTINTHNQRIEKIKFSPDGNYFATISLDQFPYPNDDNYQYFLDLYDGQTYEHIKELDRTEYRENWVADEIKSIEFSDDSRLLLQSNKGYLSSIWDISSLSKIKTIPEKNDISSMILTEDKKYLIIGTGWVKTGIFILNYSTEEYIYKYLDAMPFTGRHLDLNDNESCLLASIFDKIALLKPYWKIVNVENDKEEIPLNISYQNSVLSIEFMSQVPIETKFNLFDNNGKLVKMIFSGLSQEGVNHIEEYINLLSGVYHLQVISGNMELVKKFIVVE